MPLSHCTVPKVVFLTWIFYLYKLIRSFFAFISRDKNDIFEELLEALGPQKKLCSQIANRKHILGLQI